MTTLFINTTDNKKILLRLTINGKEYTKEADVPMRSSQKILPMIDELLHKHNLTPQDLSAIEVAEGPGSFTGVRVGVAIGNALAFALGIPVNGKKIIDGKSAVEPKY